MFKATPYSIHSLKSPGPGQQASWDTDELAIEGHIDVCHEITLYHPPQPLFLFPEHMVRGQPHVDSGNKLMKMKFSFKPLHSKK